MLLLDPGVKKLILATAETSVQYFITGYIYIHTQPT